MTIEQANQQYQEYAAMCAKENQNPYNSAEFGRQLAQSGTWQLIDKLKQYSPILIANALRELKTKQEWQNLEANDMRHGTCGVVWHMGAYELLDRYSKKIQQSYRAEQWLLDRYNACIDTISNLEAWQTASKSKQRRIKHWRERRIEIEISYHKQIQKSNRYEKLINKWRGICEQIRLADIAKEIKLERAGVGNKYGFNPNMQARDTATDVFSDD